MMRGSFLSVIICYLGVLDIIEASRLVAISQRSGQLLLIPTTNHELSTPLDCHSVDSPSFVEADLSSQLIYWTDTSSKNKGFIGCYNFLTRGETIVTELPFGARVVGLAVDGRRSLAYYSDASDGSIVAVNTETGASSTVIRGLNSSSLCCLAVNPRTGELYWKEVAYVGVGESSREGMYAYKYPNAGGSLVPAKRLLYSEHKPLSIQAIAVQDTGAYVFWCSTGTDGAQTLLKYDLSSTEIFNLPISGIQGNCTSLTADAVFLYMMTSFENGSNAIYAIPLHGSTTYFIIVQPNETTHFKDITVTDVAAASTPLTTTSAATTRTGFPTPAPTPASDLVVGLAVAFALAATVAVILCCLRIYNVSFSWEHKCRQRLPSLCCRWNETESARHGSSSVTNDRDRKTPLGPPVTYSPSNQSTYEPVDTPESVSASRDPSVVGTGYPSTIPFNGSNSSYRPWPSNGIMGPEHASANHAHAAGRPTDTRILMANERTSNDPASDMQSSCGGNRANELASTAAPSLMGEVPQARAGDAANPDATVPKVVANADQRE